MGRKFRVRVDDRDRIRAELALSLVAAGTGVPVDRMTAAGRLSGPASQARRMALYLAYVTFEWTLDHVGLVFGLNRATAAAACQWTEDARDAPAMDDLLDRLEACARQLIGRPPLELGA